VTRRTAPVERVQTQTQLLLDNLVNTPAMVLGRCFDVLAWNSLAAALFVDFNRVFEVNRAGVAFGSTVGDAL